MPSYAVEWQDESGFTHARVPWMADSAEDAAARLVASLTPQRPYVLVSVYELAADVDPARFTVRPAFTVESA